MEADASNGKVLHSGSINKTTVKDEVMRYLGGGRSTYDQKRKKYDIFCVSL